MLFGEFTAFQNLETLMMITSESICLSISSNTDVYNIPSINLSCPLHNCQVSYAKVERFILIILTVSRLVICFFWFHCKNVNCLLIFYQTDQSWMINLLKILDFDHHFISFRNRNSNTFLCGMKLKLLIDCEHQLSRQKQTKFQYEIIKCMRLISSVLKNQLK